MDVSVIIPVFNAAPFITKSVQSALALPQVKELIIIEDCSTDNSYKICNSLKSTYPIIHLVRNKYNIGAAASRNIGIHIAKCDYIGFLDADDFYLPNFLDEVEKMFSENPDADAVFGSIGAKYYNEKAKSLHINRLGGSVTGLKIQYSPQMGNLFNLLISPNIGHFSICGTIIKRAAILETGFFDESLLQSQDTDYIWRLALKKTFYGLHPGKLIAMRGVHENNRVLNMKEHILYRRKLYIKWIKHIPQYNLPNSISFILIKKLLVLHPWVKASDDLYAIRFVIKILLSAQIVIKNPKLLLHFSQKLFH